jgi:LCP family protein required for cell wall assembly
MKQKINVTIEDNQNITADTGLETEKFSIPELSHAPKKKRKFIFKFFIFLAIFCITGLTVFSSQIMMSKDTAGNWFTNLPGVKQIKYLAESADTPLKGEENDRINILLLGMGGKNHDGGYLTDTIILASLEPSTKKVSMVSIPRDLTVPMENMGWRKINNVNAFAEAENPGSGGMAVCQAISDILEIPIDYYVRLDFVGFINIIDQIGGVDVTVENTLEDYSYPVMGKEDAYPYSSRYEHLLIEKGPQHMDGTTALKYARSRHALGIEGSDFARARRQQIILEAAKSKLISKNVLFKPTMITNIIGQVQEHISTNLKVWEMVKLWGMFKDIKKEDIINKVLDNGPNGLLVNSVSSEGAYILSPRSGDFSEIKYLVNTVFQQAPTDSKVEVSGEMATVEVRNGTWINGLASQIAVDIEKLGFIIIRLGNSSRQNFQKSVIYDLTSGEKAKSLEILKNKTNANVTLEIPDWLKADIAAEIANDKNPARPDFILVLGQDADTTQSGKENPKN